MIARPMPVFEAERRDGIAALVESNASVAYLAPMKVFAPDEAVAASARAALPSSEAAVEDFTLIHFDDILATVGWNRNTDVFTREELWAARHTIDHKPINIGHEKTRIVGHVVASSLVDASFAPIDDATAVDDLPDLFHVKNESVLYRLIGDSDRDAFMSVLEAEIAAGEWFVSMEVFFSGFDYGLAADDGSKAILPRTQTTAFLTKYMRQYGGDGTYTDPVTGRSFALGRVMKNVHFKGKGVVRTPGNESSVIFSKVDAFKADYATAGYVSDTRPDAESAAPTQEHDTMTEAEAAALREELADAKDLIKTLETGQASKAFEAEKRRADSLQVEVESLKADKAAIESDAAEAARAAADRIAALEADVEAKAVALASLESERTAAARRAAVVAAGAEASLADSLVKRFAPLDDEAFAAVVEDLKPALAPKAAPATAPKAEAEIAAIDAAVVEDPAVLSVDAPDERESTRAAVIDWFSNRTPEASA